VGHAVGLLCLKVPVCAEAAAHYSFSLCEIGSAADVAVAAIVLKRYGHPLVASVGIPLRGARKVSVERVQVKLVLSALPGLVAGRCLTMYPSRLCSPHSAPASGRDF